MVLLMNINFYKEKNMLKYAKIVNQETKRVDVGLGINAEFYKSIGMTEMNVEQAYNGSWYLEGYAPKKTLEELKVEKIKELKDNCKSYIFSIYPIDKQLNIINPLNDYTEEDKQNMNIFINKNRNICKEKEELIKKAKNQKELEEIDIKF